MRKYGTKAIGALLACSLSLCFAGCDNPVVDPLTTSTTFYSSENPEPFITEDIADKETENETVDYSTYFEGIEGCAVFYNSSTNTSKVYQGNLCDEEASPNSTFKIISTLMGLKQGVLTSTDTKMGYDGTDYGMDAWNADLGLKDAFQQSCVWYFKKVIEGVGKEEVQKQLDALAFGNCDISEWDGCGVNKYNDSTATTGFWLGSSLVISPNEWVQVLANIFDGKTDYTQEQIDILKECMLIQDENGISVYGKTGTGRNLETGASENGWFVGFTENDETGEREYFAVHLTDTESEDTSGPKAKEIALNIINEQSEPANE